MPTKHLDLGCGSVPRNPYQRDEMYAVDLVVPEGSDPLRFRKANLSLEPIPFPDNTFDSVSAFDFFEHVPRILNKTENGRGTRFPFIELMDEIHRVLQPGGHLYALTPAYPSPEAFQDPTHVNTITDGTWRYFCGEAPMARMYGFGGTFQLLRNEWALHPEAFSASAELKLLRRLKRWRKSRAGRLSHLMWEFSAEK